MIRANRGALAMSERPAPQEHFRSRSEQIESVTAPHHTENRLHVTESSNTNTIAELKGKIEAQAITTHEHSAAREPHTTARSFNLGLHAKLKEEAYERTLTRVQSGLPPHQKLMSRIIHATAIDKASDLASATLGRPYGILGGSLCALLGSVYLTYAAHKSGYTYNYSWFIILYAFGYLLSVTIELMARVRKR